MKKHRLHMGLKQTEVAEFLGVSRITVIRWERDPGKAPAWALVSLAKVYSCTVEELVVQPSLAESARNR